MEWLSGEGGVSVSSSSSRMLLAAVRLSASRLAALAGEDSGRGSSELALRVSPDSIARCWSSDREERAKHPQSVERPSAAVVE